MPDFIKNKPELSECDYFYISAFRELSTCRYDSLMPIPWHAIKDYALFYSIYDFETFCHIVMALDDVVLKKRYNQMQREQSKDLRQSRAR